MKLENPASARSGSRNTSRSAFTLIEALIATSVSVMVVTAAMSYTYFAGIALSGITAQTMIDAQVGNAVELIQTRARLATSIASDTSGNTLTLAFDSNPLVDSGGDGISYNDKDFFESFTFLSVTNGTNFANSLTYSNVAGIRVLVGSGLRKLPNWNVFTATNGVAAAIRFGIMDTYARDHYQSAEIQAAAVPLNRPSATNIIIILPY